MSTAATFSIPAWLSAAPPDPAPPATPVEAWEIRFEAALDRIVDAVTMGTSLKRALTEIDRREDFPYAAFMRWMRRDAEKMRRLDEAEAIAARINASSVTDIAEDSLDNRTAEIQIKAIQWKAGVDDRARFGAKTEVSVTTISIRAALQLANERAATALPDLPIEGEIVEDTD